MSKRHYPPGVVFHAPHCFEVVTADVKTGRADTLPVLDALVRLLPTGYLMFEPDPHLLDRLRAMLRTVMEDHRIDDGIWLGSAAWLVHSR